MATPFRGPSCPIWGYIGREEWIKINDCGTTGSGNACESALAVCTETYTGPCIKSRRRPKRKHVEKFVHGYGQESCAIFYANIDYRRRDDILRLQAHHGHVMCRPAGIHRFAYVVDRDTRAVTKVQINNINFIKASFNCFYGMLVQVMPHLVPK